MSTLGKTWTPVRWTMPLVAVVRRLSERGLSDPAIAVVLELYEGTGVIKASVVQSCRTRYGITKPLSSVAARRPVKGAGNPGEALRFEGL